MDIWDNCVLSHKIIEVISFPTGTYELVAIYDASAADAA